MAQSYRWTLDDIKKLSYMQVILLQAAAKQNRKDMDERLEAARKKGTLSPSEELSEAYGGKKFTELTSSELIALAGSERAPKYIKTRKDEADGKQQEPEGE